MRQYPDALVDHFTHIHVLISPVHLTKLHQISIINRRIMLQIVRHITCAKEYTLHIYISPVLCEQILHW
jgi:hypothetical protein